MQEMMRSMQSNPAMMAQAMAQMNSMRPEDIKQASERMKNMTPEEISAQAAQASSQMSSREKYMLDAAKKLKAEGNTLHGSGSYSLAADKYERARDNIRDFTTSEAAELKRSCTLNLSSCYLNTKQYVKCVAECDLVLNEDRENLKALYRRGQAYLGNKQWHKSASDLEKAAKLSSSDIPQQKLILEKLEEAKSQIIVMKAQSNQSDVIIEDVTDEPPALTPIPRPHPPSNSGQMDDSMANAARMMAQNPEMAKMAADMLRSMPPDQIEAITRSNQLPGGMKVTPEMAKMAADSLSSMSPSEISRMAEMASSSNGSGGGGGGLGAGRMPEVTPEMAKMATEMMGKMKPEDIEQMQKMAASMNMGGGGGGGGLGSGGMPEVTPEMAKMATEMMGKMKPEDIEQMQKMAASMNMGGGGGGGSGSGGMPPAAAMDMLKDPKFMENAMGMMRSMDESSLASMMAAQGGMSKEQAEAAAKQIKGMSDTQMKMMVKAGTVLQSGAQLAIKAKEFLLSRTLLMIAVLVTLVGILLQRYYS